MRFGKRSLRNQSAPTCHDRSLFEDDYLKQRPPRKVTGIPKLGPSLFLLDVYDNRKQRRIAMRKLLVVNLSLHVCVATVAVRCRRVGCILCTVHFALRKVHTAQHAFHVSRTRTLQRYVTPFSRGGNRTNPWLDPSRDRDRSLLRPDTANGALVR